MFYEACGTSHNNLADKLTSIQSVNFKIYKERLELQVELEDSKRVLHQWSNLEKELSTGILGIASAIDAIAISQQTNLLNDHSSHLSQPLEEYLNYVDAVKEALARRDAIQFAYENSVDESNKKRQEKEELETLDSNSTGFGFKLWKISNRDRIRRLQQDLPCLDKLVEDNQDKVEIANESIKADLERWNVEKVIEMKGILENVANQHVLFYQDSLKAWETALETLKRGSQENSSSH
uniref:Sorting nexin/Vps5-like C-terminal domain-containing protein n=1 Tax=Lygus hesperus TaxID=30085 RepID=A0A0K8T2H7_LYGHE